MNAGSEQPAVGWRKSLPLALGIGAIGLLFVYLVLPGFILGMLFRIHLIDPKSNDQAVHTVVNGVFFVPFWLAEHVGPIGEFYEWQCFVVSGYR
jgi:hypothetical protein